MRRAVVPIAVLFWLMLLGAGCQSIVGIPDRTVSSSSVLCQNFCTRLFKDCSGKHAVYTSMATCLGACNLIDAGDPNEPLGDTVACRNEQLTLAESTGELDVYCPRAGPGGDGACGTNCQSYCNLLSQACPDMYALVNGCVDKCKAFKSVKGLDVVDDEQGDLLQCRLIHVSNATVDPQTHCPHAQFSPTAPCADPPNSPPACPDYCRVAMTACTGPYQVYDDDNECEKVCAVLPRGKISDTFQNTVGCRKYHSYNALADPKTHCPHAGPGGAGTCGVSYCQSYCMLLAQGCPAGFSAQFSSQDDCMKKCGNIPVAPNGYSVASTGDNVQCRVVYVSKAIATSDSTERASDCASALGGAPCN